MLATSAAREWLAHGVTTVQAVWLIGLCAGGTALLRCRSRSLSHYAMSFSGALVWVATLGVWCIPAAGAAGAVFLFRRARQRRGSLMTGLFVMVLVAPLVVAKLWLAGTGRSVPSGPLLPIGLSYLTFALVGAVIDHRRSGGESGEGGRGFALWIAHPGTRLAGPVTGVEASTKRLTRLDIGSSERLADGAWWVGLALLKKRLVADGLVALFLRGGAPDSAWLLVPYVMLSAIVLYFDATGYSDFAVGIGRWFGVDVPPSFARPVTRARDLPDLWRRWQVPLMAWFRNYVYSPLRPLLGATAAVVATFLASAMWHGMTIVWIGWGVTTGVLVITWGSVRERVPGARIVGRVMAICYVVSLAGIVQLGRTNSLNGVAVLRLPWIWVAAVPVGAGAVWLAERAPILRRRLGSRDSLIWLAAIVAAGLVVRWPFLPFVYQLF